MRTKGVAAFAFGVPATIWSNEQIALIAAEHAWPGGATVFTQRDIQFHQLQAKDGPTEYLPDEDPKNPPPTLRIARWVVQRALQDMIGEITVVAARPHIWRAMRDMEMAAEETRFPMLLIKPAPEIWSVSEAKWYCSDSTQKRVRSREEWRDREALLEMMPWEVYKRVAK